MKRHPHGWINQAINFVSGLLVSVPAPWWQRMEHGHVMQINMHMDMHMHMHMDMDMGVGVP